MSITPDKAVNQAVDTADLYMCEAKIRIDKLFGEGYARSHPDLIAVFMRVAAADFETWVANVYRAE